MPILATSIQESAESPSKSNQIRKRNRKHPNQKESKFSPFANDKILHLEILKDHKKNLLEETNSVKLQNTQSTYKNQLHSFIPTVTIQKGTQENSHFMILSKRIKYLGVNSTKEVKDLH